MSCAETAIARPCAETAIATTADRLYGKRMASHAFDSASFGRRRALRVTAALALSRLPSRPARAAAPPLIDAHFHCFAGPRDSRFPYAPDAPYRPEAFPPERALALMTETGVRGGVLVHPEPYGDDHRYLEHCLQVARGRLKGTALVFADRPGATATLAGLARRMPLVAVRIHAYRPNRLPPFGKPELRALWKQAADLGLAVQLHFEPRWAPGFAPLIAEFPKTTVLIDHLGRPMQGSPDEHAVVIGWARFPNVVMKVSEIPDPAQYPFRDPGPVIAALARAYGHERLLWGGGLGGTATAASYRAVQERVRGFLATAGLTTAQQAAVLGANAERLFRI